VALSLSFQDLDARAPAYDAAVARAPLLDRFCSSSLWILPAARHLTPSALPRMLEEQGRYVLLAKSGGFLHPLEATWGLPCPLIGDDPVAVVELLLRALAEEASWETALVTGLSDATPLWRSLLPGLARRYTLAIGPTTRRYVADLRDGIDGFLERRSAGFRRSLARAMRRGRRLGLRFEVADDAAEDGDDRFERLLAIERRSWKGLLGVGIDREPMRSFYRDMNRRLLDRGCRRLLFARLEEADVAYIFGGVFGDTYRGLQFSFAAERSSLSLGNLCQIEEIRRLTEAGFLRYDLGTEVPYKKRWGEVAPTRSVFVRR
jgi:CelD/BcsL family acetyltransferase involved in cellulose biosynthesis